MPRHIAKYVLNAFIAGISNQTARFKTQHHTLAQAQLQYASLVEHNYFLLSEFDEQFFRKKGVSRFNAFIPWATQSRPPLAPANTVDPNSKDNFSDPETDKRQAVDINILNILPRPSIIPPGRTLADIKADPICPLNYYNYKIDTSIGFQLTATVPKLIVLETGAGPNVIKLDALPTEVDIAAQPIPNDLRTASGSSPPP